MQQMLASHTLAEDCFYSEGNSLCVSDFKIILQYSLTQYKPLQLGMRLVTVKCSYSRFVKALPQSVHC